MHQLYTVHNDSQQEIAKIEILNPEVLEQSVGLIQFSVIDGWSTLETYCFKRLPVTICEKLVTIAAFPYKRKSTGFLQIVSQEYA